MIGGMRESSLRKKNTADREETHMLLNSKVRKLVSAIKKRNGEEK